MESQNGVEYKVQNGVEYKIMFGFSQLGKEHKEMKFFPFLFPIWLIFIIYKWLHIVKHTVLEYLSFKKLYDTRFEGFCC